CRFLIRGSIIHSIRFSTLGASTLLPYVSGGKIEQTKA
ncbi:MAG: hypothetical protein ACI9G6_001785, partial [Limisphaerales bacterium]